MKKYIELPSIVVFCFVLAMGITSCSDDGYSLDKFWVSMVTVNKAGDNTYDFTLDSGEKLWAAAPAGLNLKPEYKRAIINYTLLSDQFQGYSHAIRLNGFAGVLTKDVAYIAPDDEVKQDSIGHDPIRVHALWVSGGYMNIYFGFNSGGTKSHMVNLVSEQPVQPVPDVVELKFRHNKLNDPESYPVKGYASFDLAPYLKTGQDKVTFDIKWTDVGGEVKTKTIEYKYGAGIQTESIPEENNDSPNLNIH
jgi:hypothetical protein